MFGTQLAIPKKSWPWHTKIDWEVSDRNVGLNFVAQKAQNHARPPMHRLPEEIRL